MARRKLPDEKEIMLLFASIMRDEEADWRIRMHAAEYLAKKEIEKADDSIVVKVEYKK